ncbi:type VI secretion system baseplate subunit TssF [Chitinophagaceae bacterium 26-R-25]|nr:type VI secretion system baseplate subunit TssF [Chitinophagaceae bacterium 26-R-25]
MKISNQFSKEAINNRLLKNAANLWGVKNPVALDPFVRLLMEAFSLEVYRAANEMRNTQGRILDKIARLLTPSLLTMPYAAHGILQAVPKEGVYVLPSITRFNYAKRVSTRPDGPLDTHTNVGFTPVDSLKVFNAHIQYVAMGSRVFAINRATGFKEMAYNTQTSLPWATCYVAMEIGEEVETLKDLAFYFDFASFQTHSWIYQLLPLCKIRFGEEVLKTAPGLAYIEVEKKLEQEIFQDFDMMRKMCEEIKTTYDHSFLTIKSNIDPHKDQRARSIPAGLKNTLDTQSREELEKMNLYWFEIAFPANYNYEILGSMMVQINAFPVFNRILLGETYAATMGILPMRTTDILESFLSVYKVVDTSNRTYTEIPFKRTQAAEQGSYSIRQGGVERFDERSAQDMFAYLIELTRDEVAAFSSAEQGFAQDAIVALAGQLTMLDDKVRRADKFITQTPTYLIAEAYNQHDNINVEYWVSQSTLANQIRPGSPLKVDNNPELIQESLMLTETSGGRQQLQSGERLDAYRYALGTRDRLVTKDDIRQFCKLELAGKAKEIIFEKGIVISKHPKEGYTRTLDIKIYPHYYEEQKEEEWNEIANHLHRKIVAKSIDGMNYRVIIVNN